MDIQTQQLHAQRLDCFASLFCKPALQFVVICNEFTLGEISSLGQSDVCIHLKCMVSGLFGCTLQNNSQETCSTPCLLTSHAACAIRAVETAGVRHPN